MNKLIEIIFIMIISEKFKFKNLLKFILSQKHDSINKITKKKDLIKNNKDDSKISSKIILKKRIIPKNSIFNLLKNFHFKKNLMKKLTLYFINNENLFGFNNSDFEIQLFTKIIKFQKKKKMNKKKSIFF